MAVLSLALEFAGAGVVYEAIMGIGQLGFAANLGKANSKLAEIWDLFYGLYELVAGLGLQKVMLQRWSAGLRMEFQRIILSLEQLKIVGISSTIIRSSLSDMSSVNAMERLMVQQISVSIFVLAFMFFEKAPRR